MDMEIGMRIEMQMENIARSRLHEIILDRQRKIWKSNNPNDSFDNRIMKATFKNDEFTCDDVDAVYTFLSIIAKKIGNSPPEREDCQENGDIKSYSIIVDGKILSQARKALQEKDNKATSQATPG